MLSILDVAYTVGVKRRFLPGFKKFKVTGHDTEHFGDGARLLLYLMDGSILALPSVQRRVVKVYPDKRIADERVKSFRAQAMAPRERPRPQPAPPPVMEEQEHLAYEPEAYGEEAYDDQQAKYQAGHVPQHVAKLPFPGPLNH